MTDARERVQEVLAQAAAEKGEPFDPSLYAAEPAPDGPLGEQPTPDHTASMDPADAPPKPPGKLGKLGANKRPRSGVRAFVKGDRDKIVGLYTVAAMGAMMVRPPAAQAIMTQSEQCADAWIELGRENDSVRRAILFLIEGGAWGMVIAAHLPIALVFLPEETQRMIGFLTPSAPDSTEDIPE